MDINDFRVATTILSLLLFLGIMAWTWSQRSRAGFEEAARLPLVERDEGLESAGEKQCVISSAAAARFMSPASR